MGFLIWLNSHAGVALRGWSYDYDACSYCRGNKWLAQRDVTNEVHVETGWQPVKSGLSDLHHSGQRACRRLDLDPGFLHLDADLWDSLP